MLQPEQIKKMNKHHYVAIMAGGIGSRFWPMSRTNFPKQFLDILGTGKTLIQQTGIRKHCKKTIARDFGGKYFS
jgi:mannose-1-phosphate guanylyltransferase